MTNSATSTKAAPPAAARSGGHAGASGFNAWQFFALASLMGATVVVMLSPPGTHPVALLLISAAVMAAGLLGIAVTRAVSGFFIAGVEALPLPPAARDLLEREKALVLRSIKELEFDKGMGKVSEEDYAAIMTRLRAHALVLMRDLERVSAPTPAGAAAGRAAAQAESGTCQACRTANDADARFCKKCGSKLGDAR